MLLRREMWCGQRAWDGMNAAQVIMAVTCKNQKLMCPEDTPTEYAKLIKECLSIDMNDRPTFDQIVPRLEAMLKAQLSDGS